MLRELLSIAGVAWFAAAVSAQPASTDLPPEVQAALARPVSPAATALLLSHTAHVAVVERLSRALRDPDPDVRAVAARIAFTTRHQSLAEPLAAALDTESAAAPATEMMRSLALIAGRSGDAQAMKAIERLGDAPARAWVDQVGRMRPLDVLPRLAVVGIAAEAVLGRLAGSHPDEVARAFAALPTTPSLAAPYVGLIERLDRGDAPLPWPIVALGLHGTPAMRSGITRLLLHRRFDGRPLPAEAEAAIADLRSAESTAADPFLALTFELVRRRERPGEKPVPLGPTIAALDPKNTPIQGWRDPWLRRLTAGEEKALRARTYLAERKDWAEETSASPAPTPAAASPAKPSILVRMTRPLTSRLVADVAELTGCPPAADQMLAVQVGFRPTGQVRQVNQAVGTGAARCGQAALLLAALDVAPGDAPIEPDRSDLLMIGFRPDDTGCPRVDLIRGVNDLRPGTGSISAPRKVRNAQPIYPREMQDLRIQGVVVIEALIAPTGCVSDATVLRGPHTTLEAAAMAAVSQWRYTPSLLDGKPVPIVMTVTVNFTLQ